MISNYSTNSFIIKILLTGLTWGMILLDAKFNKSATQRLFTWIEIKKTLLVFSAFLLLFLISLSYTSNPAFGIQKLLTFAFIVVPLSLALIYLIKTGHQLREKIFFISTFISLIIFLILILLLKPFDYSGSYGITIMKWSHVVFAMYSAFLYALFLLKYFSLEKKRLFYLMGTSASFLTVLLSGHKSGILGMALFTLGLFLIEALKKRNGLFHFLKTHSILILSIIIAGTVFWFHFISGETVIVDRFKNLSQYQEGNFNNDGSILSRLYGYKVSLKIIMENPITGTGIGGFRNYDGTPFTNSHRYSHNIFLEVLSENGITGLVLFLITLYYVIKLNKSNIPFLFLLLFSLWFAQFSKDISTQPILFALISLGFFRAPLK